MENKHEPAAGAGPIADEPKRPARCPLLLRCLPRWSAATWRFVLITATVLFFVEVPGRRTGPTTYAHGWPFPYLTRDYMNDADFLSANPTGAKWRSQDAASPEWVAQFEQAWKDGVTPLDYELTMTPWSFKGAVRWLPAAVDGMLTVAVLLLVASIVERRRRGRPEPARLRFFQYRMRTLLLAMPVLAAVMASVAGWRRDYLAEQAALEIDLSNSGFVNEIQRIWSPPPWLPESIQKAGFQSWFGHVSELATGGDAHEVLASIKKLKHLQRLECGITDSKDLSRIAEVTSLSALSVSGDNCITADGLRQIAALPHLRDLRIYAGSLDAAAIEEMNSLKSLRELDLEYRGENSLDLNGLNNLARLTVNAGSTAQIIPGFIGTVVVSQSQPVVRLTNLPNLEQLELSNVTLDDKSCRLINRLEALKTVAITGSEINGALTIDSCPLLRTVDVSDSRVEAIALRNLPQLETLELRESCQTSSLELEHLPRLASVRDSAYMSSYDVALVDLPNLESFAVERSFVKGESQWRPPAMLRLQQAEGLPKLTSIALSKFRFDLQTIRNIGQLTRLRHLDFSGSWFTDAHAELMHNLVNLESCNLSCTNITANGLKTIVNLPQLKAVQTRGSLVRLDDASLAGLQRLVTIDTTFPNDEPSPAAEAAAAITAKGDELAFWDPWNATSDQLDNFDLPVFDGSHNLDAINLWAAHVTDAGLEHLAGHAETRALNLSATRITDEGLKHLRGMSALETLGLADTEITGAGLQNLAANKNLKALDLTETEVTDEGLKNVSYLPNLEILRLSANAITDAGLAQLKSLRKLRWLDLSRTQITDAGLAQLKNLPELRTLRLRHCAVRGDGLAQLKSLPMLDTIDLDGAKLDQAGFQNLASLPHLQRLNLLGMWLDAADWKRLAMAPDLRELSIISEKLPSNDAIAALGRLRRLKRLQITFVGPFAGPNSATDAERGEILVSLKKSLPSIEIVEAPNPDAVEDPFWSEAFNQPAGGRLVETAPDPPVSANQSGGVF